MHHGKSCIFSKIHRRPNQLHHCLVHKSSPSRLIRFLNKILNRIIVELAVMDLCLGSKILRKIGGANNV